jgi:hypothetical protein
MKSIESVPVAERKTNRGFAPKQTTKPVKQTKRKTIMKTTNKTLIAALAGIALCSFASPVQAQNNAVGDDGIAASPKVRQHLNEIKTQKEAEALKPGDTIAMVCSKCKSVMIHNVTTEKGHIKVMTVGEKHLCPGCESTITVVGVGHGAKNAVKHVCEKCGDDSVFCCASKPGSGSTKGMEKK